MKRFAIAASILGLASPALAQPDPLDQPPADLGDQDPPDPPDEPEEPPPRVLEPVDATPPPAPPPADESMSTAGRPDGFSIGIGLGWDLPADLQAPNVTSVRFRLASGLTIEPVVAVAREGTSVESDFGDSDSSELGVLGAANLRMSRQIRGKVDFILLGGAGLGFTSNNPDGPDNNSSSLLLDLHWGIGLEYWVRSQFCLSLTGSNPLFTFERENQENGPGMETTSTTNTVGIVFAPNVVLMAHLFL